ncbi:valine-tRNA ligase [Fagus crenata]
MNKTLRFFLLFALISLQFNSGFSDDSLNTKNGTKAETHATYKSSTGSTVVIIFLVVVVLVLISLFLFKLWRKKKREEQYARLLKLFEEDDELEVELGLRD